jgi:sterol desaturase/sphingolipid hydroxylase (fatty acid hydroxylase superfamily)
MDVFFTVFHTVLILFNLFGWIWKRTRRINLICLLLTAASWLLLGIFYGIGYCPLTDWHFNILGRLGYTDLPTSYISFLITRLTGLHPDQGLVDAGTAGGLVLALIISVYLTFREWFHRLAHRRKARN